MAASTAARFDLASVQEVSSLTFPVAASTTIYQGTLVAINAAGNALAAADTAGLVVVGIANQTVNNAGGAAGALSIEVQPLQTLNNVEVYAVNPLQTWVGFLVYIVDDHTAALATSTANDIVLGRVVQVNQTGASGKILVDVRDRSARA